MISLKGLQKFFIIFALFVFFIIENNVALAEICHSNNKPPTPTEMSLAPACNSSCSKACEAQYSKSCTHIPSPNASPVSCPPYTPGNTSSNSKYKCCNPNVLRFTSQNSSGCNTNSTSKNLCEIPTTPAPPTTADCVGKPIKYQSPAVNCNTYYATNNGYAGYSPSNIHSCITLPNFFGMVINTITTLGISLAMMENFSSGVVQHNNTCMKSTTTLLEGSFINFTKLKKDFCNKSSYFTDAQCIQLFLQGKDPSTASNCPTNPTSCLQNLPSSVFKTNKYRSKSPCDSLPNTDVPAVDKDGNILTDCNGNTLYCPYTFCNLPSGTIRANYDDLVASTTLPIVGTLNIGTYNTVDLAPGDEAGVGTFGIVRLKGEAQNSKVCIGMLFTLGYTTISCRAAPTPSLNWPIWDFPCVSEACQVARSPSKQNGDIYSQPASFTSITGRMMQCVTETISSIVQGNPNSVGCNNSQLLQFQLNMRGAVKVALTLYVIILGIIIAIRGDLPPKSEIAMFMAKFVFVIWAGVGTFNIENNVPVANCDGVNGWCPTNGLEFIYTSAKAVLESFPNMIMKAVCDPGSGDNCVCSYPESLYANGYEYLSLWDSIDCRISYYLGLNSPTRLGNEALGAASFVLMDSPLGWVFALIFSFELLICILFVAFAVFLISIVIFFINIYILCLLSVTILIYLGPIFIPMILFKTTASLFESWAKLILGYSLQPAVISAFIAVMIVLFDAILYGDCIFVKTYTSDGFPYWEIKCIETQGSCECSPSCKNSLGYFVATMSAGGNTSFFSWPSSTESIITFPQVAANSALAFGTAFVTALWQGAVFGFIFYHFSKQLAAFAGDLTQSTSLGGQAISPTAFADKAAYVSKIMAKKAAKRFKKAFTHKKDGPTPAKGMARKSITTSASGMKGSAGGTSSASGMKGLIGDNQASNEQSVSTSEPNNAQEDNNTSNQGQTTPQGDPLKRGYVQGVKNTAQRQRQFAGLHEAVLRSTGLMSEEEIRKAQSGHEQNIDEAEQESYNKFDADKIKATRTRTSPTDNLTSGKEDQTQDDNE